MATKTDFSAAFRKRAPEPQAALVQSSETASERPPSRRGKKHISACVDPAVKQQLKDIIAREDTTVQALICRGLNMVFIEKGMLPIADEKGSKPTG